MKSNIFIYIFIFAASFPVLQSQIAIRLDSSTGQDATVISSQPNTNFKNDQDIEGVAWSNGPVYTCRSFFKFNLSNLPPFSNIDSAKLSLYGNPSPLHSPGHSSYSGSNTSFLRKAISNWNDSTLTWNNQPPVTQQNQISLPQSTSSMQDYLNLDVTTLVRDMINNPASNYGLMIQLATEIRYRALNFASSDCPDSTKRPRLVIYFSLVGVNSISSEVPNEFKLFQNYPNPFNPNSKIKFNVSKVSFSKLSVYDAIGREIAVLVNEQLKPGTYEVDWNAGNNPSGVYFYKLQTEYYTETKKMSLVK